MNTKLIGILTAVLLFVSIAYSQTRPRESLRGLNGVYIYVLPVDKDVESGGLSTSQIQKAVETQLREAAIPIHSEPNPTDGSANLAITVDSLKHPQGTYLYAVEVSLLQEVRLARRQESDSFPAQTWSAKAMGLTGAHQMNLILEPLKAKVADFVTDYLSVNPRLHP
jgi:hypothetical protein